MNLVIYMIRFAQEKDIRKILFFIKQLAIYEKMEDDVVATEELLYDWLFVKKVANVLFVM